MPAAKGLFHKAFPDERDDVGQRSNPNEGAFHRRDGASSMLESGKISRSWKLIEVGQLIAAELALQGWGLLGEEVAGSGRS